MPRPRDPVAPAVETIRLEVTEAAASRSTSGCRRRSATSASQGVPRARRGPAVDRIRAALEAGARGPVFEALDEDGDGVRIVLE